MFQPDATTDNTLHTLRVAMGVTAIQINRLAVPPKDLQCGIDRRMVPLIFTAIKWRLWRSRLRFCPGLPPYTLRITAISLRLTSISFAVARYVGRLRLRSTRYAVRSYAGARYVWRSAVRPIESSSSSACHPDHLPDPMYYCDFRQLTGRRHKMYT